MKLRIIALITLFLSLTQANATSLRDKYLEQLDSEVAKTDAYVKQKEAEIARYKSYLSVSTSLTDKYLSCKQLANAYTKFNSDSAFAYLLRCYNYGKQSQNTEWTQQSVIRQAFIYADRGDKLTSANKLNTLGNIGNVLPQLRPEYAKALLMRYTDMGPQHNQLLAHVDRNDLWKTYSKYLSKQDPYYFLFYITLFPKTNEQWLEKELRGLQKKVRPYSFDDAMVNVLLFRIFDNQKREAEAFKCLVRSAIADIRCANRSSSSLVTVIEKLSNSNDCYPMNERLQNYMEVSSTDIRIYKDAGRSIKLIEAQSKINRDSNARNHQQHTFLTVVLVLLALALVACGIMIVKIKKSRKQLKNQLNNNETKDSELLKTIEKLEKQIALMEEDQAQKALYIENSELVARKSLKMTADFLRDIRAYKKDMARMIQANMYREAKRLATGAIAKDKALDQFYTVFDDAFQTLHPDFIDRFNALLLPEFRFKKDDSRTLSPEQRIYALISMGIEESVNIAEVLQYSSQTVYNYRLKVRKNTLQPGFKIADYVRNMYIKNGKKQPLDE